MLFVYMMLLLIPIVFEIPSPDDVATFVACDSSDTLNAMVDILLHSEVCWVLSHLPLPLTCMSGVHVSALHVVLPGT